MKSRILEESGENYYLIKKIVENKIEVTKLKVLKVIVDNTGMIVLSIMFFFLSLIGLCGLLIALSLYIGNRIDSPYLGFTIVFASIFPLLALLFFLRKQLIFTPISNWILNKIILD